MMPIAEIVCTVTLDNGKEFSQHGVMSTMLNADIFLQNPIIHGSEDLTKIQTVLSDNTFQKRFHLIGSLIMIYRALLIN